VTVDRYPCKTRSTFHNCKDDLALTKLQHGVDAMPLQDVGRELLGEI